MTDIATVIGWKFNHQPGMATRGGKIVQFPGGIPTQADQNTWTAEYEARDIVKERVDKAFSTSDRDVIVSETLFDLENRMLTLEGKPNILKFNFNKNLENLLK